MRNIAAAFALATGVFLAWHSTSSADGTGSNSAQETEIRPGGPTIKLEVSSGTLFRLPTRGRDVFVADPEVADIQISGENPELVYVFAKKPGRTALYVADAEGHIVLNRVIDVPGPVIVMRGSQIDDGNPKPIINQYTTSFSGTSSFAGPDGRSEGAVTSQATTTSNRTTVR